MGQSETENLTVTEPPSENAQSKPSLDPRAHSAHSSDRSLSPENLTLSPVLVPEDDILYDDMKNYYGARADRIELIVDHIISQVYMVTLKGTRYILKILPEKIIDPEKEGALADFMNENGIRAPRVIKNKYGQYVSQYGKKRFHIQEYIEGDVFDINCAPEWFMEKSPQLLGKIQKALIDYDKLPSMLDETFFNVTTIDTRRKMCEDVLATTQDAHTVSLINNRLRHLERVRPFEFDMSRFTNSNSHADFYITQVIRNGRELTTVDWTLASYIPVCFEVIMSYSYADPICKTGRIDADRFKRYIEEYSKYFTLNDYDLAMMPYLYYFQLSAYNFVPPYDNLSEDYYKCAILSDNVVDWFYDNVEDLSRSLREM